MSTTDSPRTTTPSQPPSSSNPKTPSSSALTRIENNLTKIIQSALTYKQEYLDNKEALSYLFEKLFKALGIQELYLPPPAPTPKPSTLFTEISNIKESLTALQSSMACLQNQAASTPPPTVTVHQSTTHATSNSKPVPANHPEPPASPTSHVNLHTTLKPSHHPSIIARIMTEDPTNHPPPHILCNTINEALKRASHSCVHLSSARWTMKGNLVLTGGHANTLQQLLSARNKISESITSKFPNIHKHSTAIHIEANIRWSKIRINNIPTSVSNNRGPWTPDECHEALLTDNPGYTKLNITQRPSWVKHSDTYRKNTMSSLVFAFEDPNSHLAQDLIDSRRMYIFGTDATVKPWTDSQAPFDRHTTPNINTNHLHNLPNLTGFTQDTKRKADDVGRGQFSHPKTLQVQDLT
ncbi:hypothetical protein EDB89DRAFT_2194199 [Lactarius sanguifluus]|nr:hypothetical protein EDB89DRAFT_2194199 [Lactarius sanguifluus]